MHRDHIYKIITKGGTMRFYGEWHGRPYDNFHRISKATLENSCLTVYFEHGEKLTVIAPSGISNKEKYFEIKKADRVIWQYTLSRGTAVNTYSYQPCGDGRILKTALGTERRFCPQEDVAVQCLSY